MKSPVVVYGKQDCGACKTVKNWLKQVGIPYTYIDVEVSEPAKNKLKEAGVQSVPYVESSFTEPFTGFNVQELAKIKSGYDKSKGSNSDDTDDDEPEQANEEVYSCDL